MKTLKRLCRFFWWPQWQDNLVVYGGLLMIVGAYILASFGD